MDIGRMRDGGHISRTVPGCPDSVLLREHLELARRRDAPDLAYMHPDVIDQMPASQ